MCALHKIPRRPAVPRPICRPAPAAGRNVYPAAALWRTGPHVCGAQCAPLQGARGFGAERAKCRDRSGEHCSPWPFDGRGAHRSGRNVCPAAALRRTGPHFCGAQCAPLQDRGSWRRAGAAAGPYSCHTSGLRMDTTVPDCRGLSVVSTSFAAHGSAFLWRTMCAATGGTGVGAGRTKCRDRSGEHCSPWPFVRRGAYRPGRNVCPRRGFAANGSACLWRTLCAATGGTGVGAGRTKCRDRSGEHCSPWPFVRRGAYRPGRDVPPAAVSRRTGPHFVAHAVRRYRGYGVGAGPRPCGERVRDFVAHAVRRYRGLRVSALGSAVSRRTGLHFVAHAVRRYRWHGFRRRAYKMPRP